MTYRTRFAVVVAVAAAAFWVVTGAWALVAPGSFAEHVATFPPANRHLTHDVGAFSLGLGATLVFGLARRAALATALAGTAVAAVLHAVSHFVDRDLGGRSSDPYTLTLFALVCLAGMAAAVTPSGRGEVVAA